MKRTIGFIFILQLICIVAISQSQDEYEVFALRYEYSGYSPAKNWAVGVGEKDSVRACEMFWLVQGADGRNILVDAGRLDTLKTSRGNYIRPDSLLERINVHPQRQNNFTRTKINFKRRISLNKATLNANGGLK